MFKASFIVLLLCLFLLLLLGEVFRRISEAKSNSATRIYDNTIITIMIITLTGRKERDGCESSSKCY